MTKPGCEGEIITTERYLGYSARCTCGWTEAEPTKIKIRKRVIDHAYGTRKEQNAYLGI